MPEKRARLTDSKIKEMKKRIESGEPLDKLLTEFNAVAAKAFTKEELQKRLDGKGKKKAKAKDSQSAGSGLLSKMKELAASNDRLKKQVADLTVRLSKLEKAFY